MSDVVVSIYDQSVLPHLRKSSSIPKEIGTKISELFKEHISRSLTTVSDQVDRCAATVVTQLESCTDVQQCNRFLQRAKANLDNLDKYISKCARTYYVGKLEEGCHKEKSSEIKTMMDPSPFCVIQRNWRKLLRDFCIEGSTVMDHLVAGGVFTEDDESSINAKISPREKTEELLKRISEKSDYDQFQKVVLPAFKEYNPDLEKFLQEDLINSRLIASDAHQRCGFCLMKENVDPKRLARYFYEKSVISINMHTTLRNNCWPFQQKWSMLLKEVKTDAAWDVLESAVRSEYRAKADMFSCHGSIARGCLCPQDEVQDCTEPANTESATKSSDIARISDLWSAFSDCPDCDRTPPICCYMFCKGIENQDRDVQLKGQTPDIEALNSKLEQFDVSLRRYSSPTYEEMRTAVIQMASASCCERCSGFICAVDCNLFCNQISEGRTVNQIKRDVIAWYREAVNTQHNAKPKIFLLLNGERDEKVHTQMERDYFFKMCPRKPATSRNNASCHPTWENSCSVELCDDEVEALEKESIFVVTSKPVAHVTGCRQNGVEEEWYLNVIDRILRRCSAGLSYSTSAKRALQRMTDRNRKCKSFYNPYTLRKPYFWSTYALRNTGYYLNGICLKRSK